MKRSSFDPKGKTSKRWCLLPWKRERKKRKGEKRWAPWLHIWTQKERGGGSMWIWIQSERKGWWFAFFFFSFIKRQVSDYAKIFKNSSFLTVLDIVTFVHYSQLNVLNKSFEINLIYWLNEYNFKENHANKKFIVRHFLILKNKGLKENEKKICISTLSIYFSLIFMQTIIGRKILFLIIV